MNQIEHNHQFKNHQLFGFFVNIISRFKVLRISKESHPPTRKNKGVKKRLCQLKILSTNLE